MQTLTILRSLNRFTTTMVEKQRGRKTETNVQLDDDSGLKTSHAPKNLAVSFKKEKLIV